MYVCMCIYIHTHTDIDTYTNIDTYIHTYRHDGVGLGRLEAAEHVLVPHNVAVGDDGHAHVLLDLADDPPVGRRRRRALVWV